MRWFARTVALLRSLGALGIILVLCIAIIGWGFYNELRVYAAIDALYGATQAQATATDVQLYLFNQGVNERQLLSSGDPSYLATFLDQAAATDAALASLQSWAGRLDEKGRAMLDGLTSAQAAQRQAVVDLAAAIEAGNLEQARGQQDGIAARQEQLGEQAGEILSAVETVRKGAVRQVDQRIQGTLLAEISGLIALPMLVLWAFAAASQGTQPILALTNAAVAIEGGQFNPEHLAAVCDRRDELGRLARAMERMAHAVELRQQQLQDRIAELRAQRYEARRRKLLPTLPRRDGDTPLL